MEDRERGAGRPEPAVEAHCPLIRHSEEDRPETKALHGEQLRPERDGEGVAGRAVDGSAGLDGVDLETGVPEECVGG